MPENQTELIAHLMRRAGFGATRDELEKSAKLVFDAVLSGKIKIEVSKKYKLSQAKQAHIDLENRVLTGPAVIIP